MISFVALWGLMAAGVIVLAVLRKMAAKGENEMIRVGDKAFTDQQAAIAGRLDKIDRWGKIVTAVAVVYGLVLLVIHLYNVWMQGQTIQ
jgi:hypothetical protein